MVTLSGMSRFRIKDEVEGFTPYRRCHGQLSTDWDTMQEADDELLINSLSMLCPFEPEDKQALLEAPSLSTRRETLTTLLEFALRGGTDEDLLQ